MYSTNQLFSINILVNGLKLSQEDVAECFTLHLSWAIFWHLTKEILFEK